MSTAKPKPAKCPWPKPQVKDMVKRAIGAMGGQKAFDYRGRGEQIAIIQAACWNAIRGASTMGPIEVDIPTMWAIEEAFRDAAGIVDDES